MTPVQPSLAAEIEPPARVASAPAARSRLLWAAVLVFGASCASLVIELVAGRLLAPLVGVSLQTWTSIIGVVLAGISLGNWFGGRLADRRPEPRLLRLVFLASSVSALLVLVLVTALGDGRALQSLPLLTRILVVTTLVFFLPSFLLGMVTPLVVKLTVRDVAHAGRTIGLLYAIGTLGSLVGTFLTGFVLVAYLPVTQIVLGVAVLLALLALVAGGGGGPSAPPPSRVDAAPAAAGPTSAGFPGGTGVACAVVAASGFCVMAVELAASRILAPTVGVSLYSWTGVIGVVLGGLSLGNWLGGMVADRSPHRATVGAGLFLGALGCFAILGAAAVVLPAGWFGDWGLMERIVALTSAVFFVPVVLLGTITPQVTRLAMRDIARAGTVAGRVHAWATAGAIVGTFATGWWLIRLVGVYPLVLGAGLGLLALAVAVSGFYREPVLLVTWLSVPALIVYGLFSRGALTSPCTRETDYFCIKIADDVLNGQPVKKLILDHLVHSYVKLGDPSFLGYPHEEVQAEIARRAAARSPAPRILLIGGGGYTFPRWVEAFVPTARMEVVEIDPGVTEIDYEQLGLARDTRIVSYNLDGRQFVREIAPRGAYDIVVQDAVNDLSVPYHILTKEYDDSVRQILTEDGVYLLTVIDRYRDGQLLRSALRTMEQSFPVVQLMAPSPIWESGGAGVFVVVGSRRGVDVEELRGTLRAQGVAQMRTTELPAEALRAYIADGPQIILTDAYAPVDNLIAGLFRSRG